jgi:hypothetical protein
MSKTLKDKVSKSHIISIVFIIFSLFIYFYNLSSWPKYFSFCELDGLKYLFKFFLDAETRYFEPHWIWHDSYLHTAGLSPLMWIVHGLPFSLMEYSNFTIRLGPILLALVSTTMAFYVLSLYFYKINSSLILLSLITAPAYLTIIRSSSIISIGFSLMLLCFSISLFIIKKPSAFKIFSFLIVIFLLCYGHTTVRIFAPIFIFLILIKLFLYKPKKYLYLYIVLLFFILLPQFHNFPVSFKLFFRAKGETILEHPFFQTHDLEQLTNFLLMLFNNLKQIFNQLFINQILKHEKVIAFSWHSTFGGLFYSWYSSAGFLFFLALAPSRLKLYSAFFFTIGILPGVFAFKGHPGLSRIGLALPFFIFMMSYGYILFFDKFFLFKGNNFLRRIKIKYCFFALVFSLNLHNYFYFQRQDTDIYEKQNTLLSQVIETTKIHFPFKKIIISCNDSVSTLCLYEFLKLREKNESNVTFHWIFDPEYIIGQVTDQHILISFFSTGLANKMYLYNLKLLKFSEELKKIDPNFIALSVKEDKDL